MNTIPTITDFDQLLKTLHSGPGYDGYDVMLGSLEVSDEELAKYCTWSSDQYGRTTVEELPSFELVVICWEPGQSSVIHDHAGQQSWYRVLRGTLREEVYYRPTSTPEPLTPKSSDDYDTGALGYMNDAQGVHRLFNASSERTISVHLHAGSFKEVNQYDAETGTASPYSVN